MKELIRTFQELQAASRWDIDFHLEPEGIKLFKRGVLKRVDEVASIAKGKRNPTLKPDEEFKYIDISSIDVVVGQIASNQELLGSEAPSRARKVVQAYDVIVSTCRPTRGAIAVVPVELHNQIASTGFSIIRPNENTNPYYLHYALRLSSTLEQFRKWSTGSSYPAILDEDVEKTLIPVPDTETQNIIAEIVSVGLKKRAEVIAAANAVWSKTIDSITDSVANETPVIALHENGKDYKLEVIRATLQKLPALIVDNGRNKDQVDAFEDCEELEKE